MAVVREFTIKWGFQYNEAQVTALKKDITAIKNLASAAGASLEGMAKKINAATKSTTRNVKDTTKAVTELRAALAQPIGPIFPMARGMGEGYAEFKRMAEERRRAMRSMLPSIASVGSPYSYFFSNLRGRSLTAPGVNWTYGDQGRMRTRYGGWSGPMGLLGAPGAKSGEIPADYEVEGGGLSTIFKQSLGLRALKGIPKIPAMAGAAAESMLKGVAKIAAIPAATGFALQLPIPFIGQSITGILHESLRSYSEITALTHSLTQVVKDPAMARKLIGQAREYTMRTPGADLQQTVQSMHMFLGTQTVDPNVIMKRLEMISNLAAMFGADFKRVAKDFVEIENAGVMSGYQKTSFIRNAIPMIGAIAKVMGVRQESVSDLIKDRQVTNKIVLKALDLLAGPGGVAYQFQQMKAQTPEGRIALLGAIWKNMQISIGEKIAPKAGEILKKVYNWLMKNGDQIVDNFVEIFRIMLASLPIIAEVSSFILNNWGAITTFLTIIAGLLVIANAKTLLIIAAVWAVKEAIMWVWDKISGFFAYANKSVTPNMQPAMWAGTMYGGLTPWSMGMFSKGNVNVNNHIMIDGTNLSQDQLSKAVQTGMDNHMAKTFRKAAYSFDRGIDTVNYAPTGK